MLTRSSGLHAYSYNAWKAFNEAFMAMPIAAVVGGRIFCVHGGLSPKLCTSFVVFASFCLSLLPSLSLCVYMSVSAYRLSRCMACMMMLTVVDCSASAASSWSAQADRRAQRIATRRSAVERPGRGQSAAWFHQARSVRDDRIGPRSVLALMLLDACRGLKRGCSYDFGPDEVARFCERNRLDMIVRAHEVVQDGFEIYQGGKLVTLFSAPNYCGEYDNAGAVMCVSERFVIDFKVLRPAGVLTTEEEDEIAAGSFERMVRLCHVSATTANGF